MADYFAISHQFLNRGELDLDELRDSGEELEIVLWDGKRRRTRIIFDSHLCYRNIDEGDAFAILEEMASVLGAADVIYRVENSSFLKWFDEESGGVYHNRKLYHYCVCTTNRIIDVVSLDEPKVVEI